MAAIRLGHSTIVLSLAVVLSTVTVPRGQSPAEGPTGRWEFTTDAPAPAATGARGRGAAPQGPVTRTVTLTLKVGPSGTLGGTVAAPPSGRGGAPGGNPSRPVEITDGKVDGTHVSFSVWQFDGYKNRMRYDGIVEGDRLVLTMTHGTASGSDRTQAVAVRKPY